MIDWKPISEDHPEEGEPVLVYNGIRVLQTKFKRGLVHPEAPFPMTHYAALELPYKPKAPDLTGIEPEPGRKRIAKGSISVCTVPGCAGAHHGKGLCSYHYSKRG